MIANSPHYTEVRNICNYQQMSWYDCADMLTDQNPVLLIFSFAVPSFVIFGFSRQQTKFASHHENKPIQFWLLKPHFYTVKLEITGVYIIFLISAQKHRLWYSLEPPRRGGSNEYPQSMFWAEIWKKKNQKFLSENFHLVVKFSKYMKRRVFVMIME